jgi:hypothetical protein
MMEDLDRAELARENLMDSTGSPTRQKRRNGIPTGNAGEYFVMGELLRRGYDAQLADRNTRDYDLLVRVEASDRFQGVQVKTVRSAPWYVKSSHFQGTLAEQITIYVLLGGLSSAKPVRYFMARNVELAARIHIPVNWTNAFMPFKAVETFEDRWSVLGAPQDLDSGR